MDEKAILSVENLNVKFRLRGEVLHAIRDISLDVYKGESLAIVGESGSGKSVFTKTFLGLLDSNGFSGWGSYLLPSRSGGSFQDGRSRHIQNRKRMADHSWQTNCHDYAGSHDQPEPFENHWRSRL